MVFKYHGHIALVLNLFLIYKTDSPLSLKYEILSMIVSLLWFIYSFYEKDLLASIFYIIFFATNIYHICEILKQDTNKPNFLVH